MPQCEYRDHIPYDPESATDADKADVYRLLNMRKLRLSKKARDELTAAQKPLPCTLEDLVKGHDPQRKRYVPGTKDTLHNEEYLISIYMDSIGRPAAVPDSWRIPYPHKPGFACRINKTMPAPAPRPARAEGEFLEFDPLDISGYASCHREGCNCQASLRSQRRTLYRMSLGEKAETGAERVACMDIRLWKHYSSSNEEEREAHLCTYLRRFRKQSTGKSNKSATAILRAYDVSFSLLEAQQIWRDKPVSCVLPCMQRYCGLGNVKAITSQQEYEAFLSWQAARCNEHNRQDQTLRTTRNFAAILAQFHGYVPITFKWGDSQYACNLMYEVAERARALTSDTDGKTVNQQNATLSRDQLNAIYRWAMTQPAAPCATLLAFCGVVSQTLARSEQLCEMNTVHMSIYPEAAPYKLPLFGPTKMLHLGDRGHHKVNKSSDMAHWVMRTLEPSLACPWFGLALKAMLDARQQGEERYRDIQEEVTGICLLSKETCKTYTCRHITWSTHCICVCSGDQRKGCKDQEEACP